MKRGQPYRPSTLAAFDRVRPEIERLVYEGASKRRLARTLIEAGIPRKTAYRLLESYDGEHIPTLAMVEAAPSSPGGQEGGHSERRMDLVKALKARGREATDELARLKRQIAEEAQAGVSRTRLTRMLMDAGLAERPARRFLEPYYQDPDPIARLEKDLTCLVEREEQRKMNAHIDAVGWESGRRLAAGESQEAVLRWVVDELGRYGITLESARMITERINNLFGRIFTP